MIGHGIFKRIKRSEANCGGAAGGPVQGLPWQPSSGVRPVAGLGVEWFHRFFRIDVGIGLRDGDVSVVFDVTRDLWDIL